jgi:hypothetical protein
MLRVDEMDIARPTQHQVPNVVEDASARTTPKTRSATRGTGTMDETATAMNDLRFGEIFRLRDPFRHIGKVLSRTRHGNALLGQVSLASNVRHGHACVMIKVPLLMLKTRKSAVFLLRL